MKHTLYRLENTKIIFKHYWPINSKLCQPTFNYPRLHVINIINYDSIYSKALYKYFFKAFYNRMNKKKQNLEIQQHNIYQTNIIVIKDIIILKKTRENKKLLESITNITVEAEVAQASSLINLA